MKIINMLEASSRGEDVLTLDPQQEICRRAYEIYEERGKIDGYDVEDWLRAEAEIMTHRFMRKAA